MRSLIQFIVFYILLFISVNVSAYETQFNLDCMNNSVIYSTLGQRNINIAISACSNELIQKLKPINSPQLITKDAIKLILAMVISHNTAPYGSTTSKSIEYEELIKHDKLHCGTYAILMAYLVPDMKIHIIGFDGGAVGNHAQIIYKDSSIALLLDPTVSTIAEVTYDSLLQGVKAKNVITINPNPNNIPEIRDDFTNKVVSALRDGKYKSSSILYYYESLNHMLGKGPKDPYITPGGISWGSRRPIDSNNFPAHFEDLYHL
ncbi:MAG: hypothetical protein H0U75_10880 [Legionella sp.]|nr:hypothetical protein [Legionella sp.]